MRIRFSSDPEVFGDNPGFKIGEAVELSTEEAVVWISRDVAEEIPDDAAGAFNIHDNLISVIRAGDKS